MATDKRHHSGAPIVVDGTAYDKTLSQEDAEFRRMLRDYSQQRITVDEIRQRDTSNHTRQVHAVRVPAEAENQVVG
jgi:hypothetical protein